MGLWHSQICQLTHTPHNNTEVFQMTMSVNVNDELMTYKEFVVIPNLNRSILACCCNPPTFLAICTCSWNCSSTLNCLWLDYTLVLFATVDVPQSQRPKHCIQFLQQFYTVFQKTSPFLLLLFATHLRCGGLALLENY